jgi:TetR/AcrR family transcriptional regulator, copper-responsive repressor
MVKLSLYAAFGNKEELYVRALRHYAGRNIAAMQAILSRPGTIEARLGEVYLAAVDLYTAPPLAAGCMIIGTATVEAPGSEKIATAATELLADIDAHFEQAFARAVAAGELSADPPPAARARLAGAILDTLAVRARLGAKAADLKAFARSTVPVICR